MVSVGGSTGAVVEVRVFFSTQAEAQAAMDMAQTLWPDAAKLTLFLTSTGVTVGFAPQYTQVP